MVFLRKTLRNNPKHLAVFCSVLLTSACSVTTPEHSALDQEHSSLNFSKSSQVTNTTAAPARDGNIAIREEFEVAKQKNTVKAYDLFIARHPNHYLAETAKALKLKAQN